ncbi:MAG: ribonuclease H-like domain-containing protein [Planctomycetota bacterium]|jgi:predicted PolB exonuclease-like 3'-5' exonuclease
MAENLRVRRLYWDIETSPNIGFFWRPGWKVTIDPENIIQERAIICICYKWEGQKKVHSLKWDRQKPYGGDDKKMIKDFAKVIAEADEMVAHNGDKFDMAWYNGRHLIHGLDPVPKAKTIDTYKMAARNFNLNSYKLDYLAKILLGEGKIHTNYDMWKKIVLNNDEASMKKMITYCKKDVVLLERVWQKLSAYEDPETHAAVMATGNVRDRWMCKHCGSDNVTKNKTRVTKAGMIQHGMQCKSCGRYYQIANLVYHWYLEHKEG